MDAAENIINGSVSATPIPPTLDDAHVIPKDAEWAVGWGIEGKEGKDEELKPDCFGPSNVTLATASLPTRDEAPRPPSARDNNPHPNA